MQNGWLERFGQVIFRAHLDPFDDAFQVAIGGNDNDGDRPRCWVSFGFFEHAEAIHDGHHDIEQNQIGFFALDSLQSFLSICSGEEFVFGSVEFLFEIVYVKGFVVYDQDAGFGEQEVSLVLFSGGRSSKK